MNHPAESPGPATNEAESVPPHRHGRSNGAKRAKRKHGAAPDLRPVPPVSVRALVEERNWTALAGLALLGTGVLILLQDVLGLHLRLNLWALMLLGLGGWLIMDGWQRHERASHTWDDIARRRVQFGALIAAIGLLGILELNWWSLLLVVIGARLGIDTWRQVEAAGHVWTRRQRHKMLFAVVVGGLGLLTLMNLGSAGPLLLILIGGGLLIERASTHHR